ncbi:SDR family NAD(P)-dependent oxidoreductase [Novosphingobium lentum]|uniref:SDR family NAD(P)-dependent oxidoreductase n=1 Tax=Novosphingobium lentum TaxID=145287 RepID=UPI00082B2F3E|nr:SDR family oxidoreductase [Novosphingobium lentum]
MIKEDDRPESKVDLTGRSAIVTGAGSGIGRAIALTLARSGAEVMVNDIIGDRANETVAMIAAAGCKAAANVSDIADENAVAGFVGDAMAHWGKIDILCNNAGIMDKIEFVEDVSTELWNRVFAVNVTGQFFVMRAVLPHMRAARKGAIVNTVSEAGLRGGAAGATYVAAKHALAGLTKSVAWSHANEGIRCNGICPGAIETNITGGLGLEAFDPRGLARAGPVMALCERAAGPQAIANAALFLASDAAYYINGVMLPVDGGWMAG